MQTAASPAGLSAMAWGASLGAGAGLAELGWGLGFCFLAKSGVTRCCCSVAHSLNGEASDLRLGVGQVSHERLPQELGTSGQIARLSVFLVCVITITAPVAQVCCEG